MPRYAYSRAGPFVSGWILIPATLTSGSASSVIGRKLGRASSSIHRRSGDSAMDGGLSASRIAWMSAGGCW